MKQIKSPTILQALFPIIFLVVLLTINVSVFGDDALSGSIQIVLILSSAFASIIAFNLGFTWLEIQKGIEVKMKTDLNVSKSLKFKSLEVVLEIQNSKVLK